MKQLFLFLVCTTCSVFLSAQSGFVINPGIHIVKSGSPLLVLNNMNFTNNGNFIPATGTVKLTGTNTIGVKGNNSTDFYNLYAGSSAEVKLEQNIFVQHELKMGGMLQVQSQSINFEPGALIVDESETAHLQAMSGNTGYATTTVDLNLALLNVNPSALGVEFVNAPALGTTTIKRYCAVFSGTGLGSPSIQRHYDIQPANNSSLNASVRFYYFDAELNGVDETSAVLWRSSDNGQSWTQMTPDSRNVTNNFLQKDNVNDFSLWTIGSPSAALPILLSSFNVACKEKGAELVWTTAWEQNNDRFIVEKSTNGTQWSEIAVISARNIPADYKFSDTEAGNAYYRLKQVDKDGTFTYSKILRSSCPIASIKLIIYPNPINDYADLVFQSDKNFIGHVQVFTAAGQLVKRVQIQVQRGQNKIRINVPGLTKGTYLLRIDEGDLQLQKKFIKL